MTEKKKWKIFERLVAGIHKAKTYGAKVIWNEKIDGRQFDATIRFKVGLYDYLTVVECKNYATKIPVGNVEAFVTKSRSVNADKAVMVSSKGFQSGGIKVAKENNIELFSLSEINEFPAELLLNEILPAINVYDIKFKITDSSDWIELPEDRNLIEYLMKNVYLTSNDKKLKLHEIFKMIEEDVLKVINSDENKYDLVLQKNSVIYLPHLREEKNVEVMTFKFKLNSFQMLKKHTELDPYFFQNIYNYKDELTGNENKITRLDTSNIFNTKLQPKHFYVNPNIGHSFYCRSINGENVKMSLIESYQHGELFQADFSCSKDFGCQVVEITDNEEIERLKKVGNAVFKHNKTEFKDLS